jgi:H+/Cl- antiporter ClcA
MPENLDEQEQDAATGEICWEVSRLQTWFQHGLFIAAAVATGCMAWFFWFAEEAGNQWFDHLQKVHYPADKVWFVPAEVVNTVVPMVTITLGMLVILQLRMRYFPGTEGTGIPQAIAALKTEDGPIRKQMLSWRIAIGKTLLLVVGLFTGMTIGREGPSVHVGACLMYLITKITRFPQHLVQRGLILGGGGAGIAAAFNAPVAGAIFALEEIGRSFEKNNIGTIIRTVLLACLVVILGRGTDYLFYGEVKITVENWPWHQWLSIPIIGGVGGLLGGLFARAVVATTRVINPLLYRRRVLVPLGLGATLALIGLISGGESYGSGFPQAQSILMDGGEYPWHYAPMKALANFVCLISGIPGGLFDPSLSVGAGLGQTLKPLMLFVFPHLEPTSVVMLFMVAYFAGVVQSPITCAVIMVEMTAARFMTIPLLATAIIAYECSHRICPNSIYEALSEIFLAGIRKREAETGGASC